MTNLTIALVDNQKMLLDGLESILSSNEDYKVAIKAVSGDDLLRRTDLETIQLIIMDIALTGKDGIKVLHELRERNYTGACIFLTSYRDLKFVNEAIKLGARGYLTKGSAGEYLEAAIKNVIQGQHYYSPDIQNKILGAFSKNNNSQIVPSEECEFGRLTTREVEVLKLIAQENTSVEISEKLFIAKSTVDTHRKNLIFKLQVKNAVGLGLVALRNNLV